MPIARPPLAPADYQRIVRVLKTVYDAAPEQLAPAALFFNIAGARLVEQVYKKRCQPIAGAAFYKLDDAAQTVLAFHDDKAQEHLSSRAGFHCWTLCEGFVIDFMAPLFREALQTGTPGAICSRKMFQKPLEAISDSRLQMRKPGDYFMLPNVALTQELLQEFLSRDLAGDWLEICAHWYRKPPAKMEQELALQRGDGGVVRLKLSEMAVDGIW